MENSELAVIWERKSNSLKSALKMRMAKPLIDTSYMHDNILPNTDLRLYKKNTQARNRALYTDKMPANKANRKGMRGN